MSLITRVTQNGRNEQTWSLKPDLSEAKDGDPWFVLDAPNGKIQFGDGTRGRIPTPGCVVIAKSYRAGGGTVGNVKAKAITFKIPANGSNSPGVWNGTNPFAASGGTDAELAEGLRQRAPARLRSLDRAVIQTDYEDLARRKGRMARARVFPSLHPDFPELKGKMPGVVTVFVVAALRSNGDVPPWPTEAELDTVTAELEMRRTIGCELFVRPAEIVPIQVILTIAPTDGLARDLVQKAVSQALNRQLNDDGRGIGTPLYAGDVWAWALETKVGPTIAVRQIYDLLIDAGRFGTLHLQLSREGKNRHKTIAGEKGESVALLIPDHAVLWGRPDHEIHLDGKS